MSEQQVKVLSMSMTEVEVTAAVQGAHFTGEQISARLPVNPGIYADQTDIILSNQHTSADLTIYGTTAALQQLEVMITSLSLSVNCVWQMKLARLQAIESNKIIIHHIYQCFPHMDFTCAG